MPIAANEGDACIIHCSIPYVAKGAKTVIVGGRPAARAGDPIGIHLQPGGDGCTPHASTIAKGSINVIIEGQNAARLGDPLVACTAIASPGTPTVIIGG